MQQEDQDQFSNFDDLTGDDGMLDDSADGVYEQPAPVRDGAAKRKKIFLGAVILIVGLGVVMGWLILSQDNTAPVAPVPAPAAVAVAPAPVASTAAIVPPPPLPAGVTTDPAIPAGQLQPVTTSDATKPVDSAMPAPVVPDLVPADETQATEEAAIVADTTPPVDPQAMERLVAMETQLQELSATLVNLNNMPAPAASASGGVDNATLEKISALTLQLDQMVSQLDALDQRTTTLATEVQNVATAEVPKAPTKIEKVIATKEEEEIFEPSLSDEMPKPATPVKKAAAPVKKPVVKKAAAPAPVRSWELRSAQPGIAWLGRPGSGEMARYAVGENVPGLGTVRSVSQDANGNWSVNTNGGVIRQ